MLRIKDLLYICLVRLPFLLVLYGLVLIFSDDSSVSLLLTMIGVFVLIAAIDVLIKHNILVAIIGATLCAGFFLLEMPVPAIMTVCAVVYRIRSYSGALNVLWLFFLCAETFLATLYAPSVIHVCIRNVLIAAVSALLSRQIRTLDRFLNSYYCWGISQKTAAKLVRRVYRLTAVCFAVIVIAGLLLARPDIPGIVFSGNDADVNKVQDMSKGEAPEQEVEHPLPPPPEDLLETATPPADLDEFETVMESFLTVVWYSLFALSITLIVIFLMYRILKRAASQFDDFEEVVEEENADLSGMPVKSRKARLKLGPTRTVRRLFRSKVREHIQANALFALRSDTPEDLSRKIAIWEDVGALKRLYHKARYSGQSVSRAELSEFYSQRG